MDGNSYYSRPVTAGENHTSMESHEIDGASAVTGADAGVCGKKSKWERESREGEGVARQDTPLMELDAQESEWRRWYIYRYIIQLV